MQNDTYETVKRQLEAMKCESYQVLLEQITIKDGLARYSNKHEFQCTAQEILSEVPWLKTQNKDSTNILIGPSKPDGLIKIRSNGEGTHQLRKDGFTPAAVIDCQVLNEPIPSWWPDDRVNQYNHNWEPPDSFESWIRVDTNPIPNDLRRSIGHHLQNNYPVSVDSQLGYLAGFNTYKESKFSIDDVEIYHQPTTLYSSQGGVTGKAEHLLNKGRELLEHGRFVRAAANHILERKGKRTAFQSNTPLEPLIAHRGPNYHIFQRPNSLSVQKRVSKAGQSFAPILEIVSNKVVVNNLTKADVKNFAAAVNHLQKGREKRIRASLDLGR